MSEQIKSSEVDFSLCEILYKISTILELFPGDGLQVEINNVLQSIQHKKFQVAVVGDFKRGKSTLINALLGMPILPTDIEPTTAAINRITYGIKPKAIIHYKDGSESEVPIHELSGYVTKLTSESAQIASAVQEAEIQYPTALCENHIDIIDTPGLNDDQSMTAVTEQMLDEINVAVVAVNASLPYSDTESRWVAKLLTLPKLQHVVFVLTYMDLVPGKDKERLIAYISKRICEKTLDYVRQNDSSNGDAVQKAERIFSEKEFMIYPVSAVMALDSFDNGNYDLLEGSGVPSLKKALVSIMNAQQQMKGVYSTEKVVERLSAKLSATPIEYCTAAMDKQQEALNAAGERIHSYFARRSVLIDNSLEKMNAELDYASSVWLSDDNIEDVIKKVFIKHLGSVTVDSREAILTAISNAESEVKAVVLPSLRTGYLKAINAAIIRGLNSFFELREDELQFHENAALLTECGFQTSEVLKAQLIEHLRGGIDCALPEFSISMPKLLLNRNIIQTVITPYVSLFGGRYRKAWQDVVPEYSQKWVSIVLREEPAALRARADHMIHGRLGALAEKSRQLQDSYKKAESVINESEASIQKIKELIA